MRSPGCAPWVPLLLLLLLLCVCFCFCFCCCFCVACVFAFALPCLLLCFCFCFCFCCCLCFAFVFAFAWFCFCFAFLCFAFAFAFSVAVAFAFAFPLALFLLLRAFAFAVLLLCFACAFVLPLIVTGLPRSFRGHGAAFDTARTIRPNARGNPFWRTLGGGGFLVTTLSAVGKKVYTLTEICNVKIMQKVLGSSNLATLKCLLNFQETHGHRSFGNV